MLSTDSTCDSCYDCVSAPMQVSTNGILSFGRAFPYHSPHPFPGTSFYNFLIAPFWADTDISGGVGNVSYELHENETDAMGWVNTFISQQQQINFTGSWMLVAEWRNVPAYQGQQTEVCYMFTAWPVLN